MFKKEETLEQYLNKNFIRQQSDLERLYAIDKDILPPLEKAGFDISPHTKAHLVGYTFKETIKDIREVKLQGDYKPVEVLRSMPILRRLSFFEGCRVDVGIMISVGEWYLISQLKNHDALVAVAIDAIKHVDLSKRNLIMDGLTKINISRTVAIYYSTHLRGRDIFKILEN